MEAEITKKLSEVCRLCLIPKDNVVDLFEFNDSTKNCWADVINYALDVKVMQRNTLPSKGCMTCIGKVKFAVPFKSMCMRSDAHLKGMPLEETGVTIAHRARKTPEKSFYMVIKSEHGQGSRDPFESSKAGTDGNVCRLCLKADYPILDLFKNAPMQHVTLNEVLSFSLSIKASEGDGFPKTVCSLCAGKLYVLNNFKKQFLDSSRILFLPLEPKSKVDEDFDTELDIDHELPENWVLLASNNLTCINPPLSDINLQTCPECNEVHCGNNIDQFIGCQPTIGGMKCIGCSTTECQRLLPVTVGVKRFENTQLGSKKLPASKKQGRKLSVRGEEYPGPMWSDYVYKCGVCGKRHPRKLSAIEHTRTHLNTKLVIFKERKDRRYPCDMCARVYQTKSGLRYHKMTHGERKFCCGFCPSKFHNRCGLRHHLLIHSVERPFHCNHCPAKFRTKEVLKAHMLRHNGNKKFLCDRCPIRFYRKCLLDRHILSHTGEKPHPCPVCFRRFSLKVNLMYHTRTHSGEKPYTCAHCLRSFSMKCSLGEHTKIHTGVHPYPCSSCGKAFKSVSAMHKHESTHAKKMELKCRVCLNGFNSRKFLRAHLKLEHDVG